MTDPFDTTQEFLDHLPRIEPGQPFRFACHPRVDCFNACCSDLTLGLTPYDCLRLRAALGLSSEAFLAAHAQILVAPDTGFPAVRLRMAEDARKSCPFVSPAGCAVYPHRPGACRIYPLGRATRLDEAGDLVEQYFLVREPHCHGFAECADWTSATWFDDQGLVPYNRVNDRLMAIMTRQRGLGHPIGQKQTSMAMLCLYQPDRFQQFIRQMRLFDRLELTDERQGLILADDEAALEFGLDWLELLLFGRSGGLAMSGRKA
jgi:Fe-S-cluster containining protein